MAVAIKKVAEVFLTTEKEIVEEVGMSIKFDLTNDERVDLFIITKMYRRDKGFTKYIRESLSIYMEAWKEINNL